MLSAPYVAIIARSEGDTMDDMPLGCIAVIGIALLVLVIAVITGSELGGLAMLALVILGVFVYGTRNS